MSIPMMRNRDGLVVIVQGTSYNVRSDHSKYGLLVKAIKENDEQTFLDNVTEEKVIQSYINNSSVLSNKVELKDGEVLYNGRPIHSTLTKRILEFKNEGLPFEPLLKFMEKLYQNPSSKAVNELYDFLENKNLPITPDGDFLAYKSVRSDYYSVTAGSLPLLKGTVNSEGRVYNGIGEEIECARNEVDDNRDNECSYGLHVGGLEYVTNFGGSKIVIVKVNPADIIAVPKDYNAQKARVCHYFVVEDYKQALPDSLSTHCNCSSCDENNDSEYDEYVDNYENNYTDEYEEDDEYDDDEYEYEDDDESMYEGLSVTSEQVRSGDEISFNYKNEERVISVDSTDVNLVHGQLLPDDVKWSADSNNYRNFKKSDMSNIRVLN